MKFRLIWRNFLGFGRVVGSGIIVKFSVSAIRLEFAQYALVTPSEALCEGWCNLVNVGFWAVAVPGQV